jgi:hypothetical protein
LPDAWQHPGTSTDEDRKSSAKATGDRPVIGMSALCGLGQA